MNPKYKRNYILNIFLSGIIFFVIILSIFYSFYINSEKITHNYTNTIANEYSYAMNNLIEQDINIISMASETIQYMLSEKTPNNKIIEYLQDTTRGYTKYTDSDFTGIYGYINDEYMDGTNWIPDRNFIPTNRPWYIKAKEANGEIAITDLYTDKKTGETIISIAKLLTDGVSVISLDVNLKKIQNYTKKLGESIFGYAVVLDKNNNIVSASKKTEQYKYLFKKDKIIINANDFENNKIYVKKINNTSSIVVENNLLNGWKSIIIINEQYIYRDYIKRFAVCLITSLSILFLMIYYTCIINKKNKNAEYLSNILKAASTNYLAIYSIDIEEDSYKIISTEKHIGDILGEDTDEAQKTIKELIEKIVSKDYMKYMLNFINIKTLEKRLQDAKTISMEFLNINHHWCRARFIKTYVNDNKITNVLFIVDNINTEKKRENKLKDLAEHDKLTGILNRGSGENKVKQIISHKGYGMFCLLDADKFKSINDDFGHAVGDKVIKSIASTLTDTFTENDIVFRLGGDEFVVFVRGITDTNSATPILDILLDNISKIKIKEIKKRKIEISLGASFKLKDDNKTFDDLYSETDLCVYKSKKINGSAYTFYKKEKEGKDEKNITDINNDSSTNRMSKKGRKKRK